MSDVWNKTGGTIVDFSLGMMYLFENYFLFRSDGAITSVSNLLTSLELIVQNEKGDG
jgi:hypothetical protein